MSAAKARIKLQVWEWIPDKVVDVAHVVVYDPKTIMPQYAGHTDLKGFVEFEIDAGMYVIWVYGHNPMGYRPFLSDTWIPVAVFPGETKEVCAALVSLIDIPILQEKVDQWFDWGEPKIFAELLKQYSNGTQKECNRTAIAQREAFLKKYKDVDKGMVVRIDKEIVVAEDLVKSRRIWAEDIVKEAKPLGPRAMELAEAAKKVHADDIRLLPKKHTLV